MATGLGQLLVEDGAVHPDRLEEAYQRQVLYGGQLDTVLLEMGLIDEATLLGAMSRQLGLPLADREALDNIAPELGRRLPRRLAESYRLVPLRLDRRHLHVACCRPLPLDVVDDISFTLSLYLVPHVTTELRLNQALQRVYGARMEARFEHLLAQLGEDYEVEAPPASVAPVPAPDVETEPAPELEPPPVRAVEPATAEPPAEVPRGWVVDEPARTVAPPVELDADRHRDDPVESWQAVPASEAGIEMSEIRFDRPAEAVSSLLTGGVVELDESFLDAAPARLVQRLQAEDQEQAARAARRAERVSWTPQDAAAELALAGSRDEVVEVMLRYAHRRLQRVAVFVLMDEAFIGWDAIGGELEARVTRLRIPVEASPALHLVRRTGAASLGPLATGDALLQALGGPPPRAVAIAPFFVRDRLLGVLVGDCGDDAIQPTLLTELQLLMPEVRLALEVVILRRKRALKATGAETADAGGPAPAATAPAAADAVAADPAPPGSPDPDPPATIGAPIAPSAPEPLAPPTGASSAAAELEAVTEAELARALDDEAAALDLATRLRRMPGSKRVQELVQQVDAHEENAPERREALRRLEALGASALPALLRAFPGRLRVDLFGNYDLRPNASALSGIHEALLRLGPAAVAPVVVEALGSAERAPRIAAVVLAGELPIPAAQPRLCACLLDPEARIAFTAAEICTRHGRTPLPPWAAAALEQALRETDPERLHRAVRASRACLHRGAVPALVQLLDGGSRELVDDVVDALREISKQDLGQSAAKWRQWLQQHGHQRRVEWLLAGLAQRDRDLRHDAQHELSALSGDLFGYSYDAPRADRDAALERWRAWWERARHRDDLP